MAPSTPYFDLLDDPLVQQIIRSVPDLRYDTSRCRNLSETSRRMCALVSGSWTVLGRWALVGGGARAEERLWSSMSPRKHPLLSCWPRALHNWHNTNSYVTHPPSPGLVDGDEGRQHLQLA
jgi:hypothetical protein